MKKFWLSFFFFFALTVAVTANDDNRYQVGLVNFEKPEQWTVQKPIRKRSTILTFGEERLATINIVQKDFITPITANALQEKRAISHFDGWIKILSRPSSDKERIQANADDASVAVYVKQFVNSSLQLDEFLTGEYYYIKDSTAFVVSISTSKDFWQTIQPDIKFFLNSLWLGSGLRPQYMPSEKTSMDWLEPGNNNNKNYIDANPELRHEPQLKWELVITQNNTASSAPIISKNDTLFVLKDNALLKIHYETGEVLWEYPLYLSVDSDYLSYNSGLLFIISQGSSPQLIALSADSSEVIYKIPLSPDHSPPVFMNGNIYLNEEGAISCYNMPNGQLMWSKEHNSKKNTALFCTPEALILQQSNNKMLAINPLTGNFLWESAPVNLLHKPSCTDSLLFLPIKGALNAEKLMALSVKTGEIEWIFDKSILNFSFSGPTSVTKQFAIISGSVVNDTTGEREHLLININTRNGKVGWEKPIPGPCKRPLVTESNVFTFFDESQSLLILDSLTGEQIPTFDSSSQSLVLQNFMVYKQLFLKLFIDTSSKQFILKCYG